MTGESRRGVPIPMLVRVLVVTAALAAASAACGIGSANQDPIHTPAERTTSAPGSVARALAALPVKGRAPKTGYDRSDFGQAWSDDVSVPGGHNGCDTRNDVLRRDLTAVTIRPGTHGCLVVSGTLDDAYTGRRIPFLRGESTSAHVQIDHVVALSDAWQTGAAQLTAERVERRRRCGYLAASEQAAPLPLRRSPCRGQDRLPAVGDAGRGRRDRPCAEELPGRAAPDGGAVGDARGRANRALIGAGTMPAQPDCSGRPAGVVSGPNALIIARYSLPSQSVSRLTTR